MGVLTSTNEGSRSLGILLLRLVLGAVLFMIGAGKLLGWFGGYGLAATVAAYSSMWHIGAFWAYVSIFTEFIGSILLIIGLLTRFAAVAVAINLLVAYIVVMPKGFIMGLADFPFALMVVAISIILIGPGRYSLDKLISIK